MGKELQGTEFVQLDARHRGSPWEAVLRRFGGRIGVLAAFLVAHATLVWLDYSFKESISAPAVMWPSAGLLFAALWLSDRRFWPAFLALHVLVEFSFAALMQDPFVPGLAILFVLANAIDAIVGASIARWLIRDRSQVRTTQTLQFIFAAAVGSLVGALLGATVNSSGFYFAQDTLQQIQVWWVGNWLGSLAVAPVVFCWCIPVRKDFPELALRSRVEVLVLAVLLTLASFYVFNSLPGGAALAAATAGHHAGAAGICRLPSAAAVGSHACHGHGAAVRRTGLRIEGAVCRSGSVQPYRAGAGLPGYGGSPDLCAGHRADRKADYSGPA